MSENNTTTKGSFHSSLRLTLDHMAEEGYIGWDDDYDTRRNNFFAALASEDDNTSTVHGALEATFGDLVDPHKAVAYGMFDHAFNKGKTPSREKRTTGSKLGGAVRDSIAALRN